MTERVYGSLSDLVVEMADVLRPPERLTVSSAAEKYRYINVPGGYVGPWRNATTPYLVEVMDTLQSREFNSVVFCAPAQSGKPLWIRTPVATPTGWTTMGDLKSGDQVFAQDGTVTTVVATTEVFRGRDCYEITFDDGSTIVADAEHRWAVNDVWAHDPYALRVKTTAELLDKYRIKTSKGTWRFRYSIPNARPIDLPEADLSIHPYLLGLWLGDGNARNGSLTLNTTDCAHIVSRLCRFGVGLTVYPGAGNPAGTVDRVHIHGLTTAITERGLRRNKRIPKAYLRASIEQRLELLRGLMDTDGHIAKNAAAEISQSNEKLADDIYELVVSLGYKATRDDRIPTFTHRGEKRRGKRSYRISFYPGDTLCCTLPRAQARIALHSENVVLRPTHTSRRFIRAIEQVKSVPVRCVAVDHASHLFLVGPQMVPTHNTDAGINWLAYSVICDPMDMILYQTSQVTARDFSRRRIDRLNRFTREVGNRLLARGDADNTYDKYYRNGMIFTLSWPSIGELSGRPVGRVWLTDLDRMPQDVDGEGSPFDLARKRTTTFGSAAMTYVESSPGFEIEDPKWIRRSPHESPPSPGILALYNRGDRRRWFWPCVHCGEYFEPEFALLKWPDTADIMEAAENAKMLCVHCGGLIEPSHKHEMNLRGRWVREGQSVKPDGTIVGTPVRADIASFWLKGPAATFASWTDLVSRYLLAEQEFQRTGSQEALKSTINTDQGEAFYPRGLDRERLPDELKSRAIEGVDREVPLDVRFLLATVDVQKNRWVVQVFGVGPGIADEPFRITVVDRFDIVKSKRLDDDGERWPVRPAKYPEDWDLLTEQVLDREYPMADGSGLMRVALLGVDSGGREGVTTNAYNWYRKLRRDGRGEHQRIFLVKGEALPSTPRVRLSYPDSPKKDRRAGARGEIPVLILNTNLVKDALNNMVERGISDNASFTWPAWLPDEWFAEMCAEHRTPKGWENPRKARNEAWDLATYALAILIYKKIDRLKWDTPILTMAAERPKNPYFRPVTAASQQTVADAAAGSYSLARLAAELA